MATYNFKQYVLLKIWGRQMFSVEADSKEEAIEKAKQYANIDICDAAGFDKAELERNNVKATDDFDYLYDTVEPLISKKNEPIIEIEDMDFNVICSNANDGVDGNN